MGLYLCLNIATRPGAPFYTLFGQLMGRLEDAGIIAYWTDDVIAQRVRKTRQEEQLDHTTPPHNVSIVEMFQFNRRLSLTSLSSQSTIA